MVFHFVIRAVGRLMTGFRIHLKGHDFCPKREKLCQPSCALNYAAAYGELRDSCIRSKHMLYHPMRTNLVIRIRMACCPDHIHVHRTRFVFPMQSDTSAYPATMQNMQERLLRVHYFGVFTCDHAVFCLLVGGQQFLSLAKVSRE